MGLQLFRFDPTGLSRLGHNSGKVHKLQPKSKNPNELKVALHAILEELTQEHINKAVANFTKHLITYMAVAANGVHSEHLQ